MKKNALRTIVVAAVLLVIYHLIAFLVPFVHTGAFWVSYVFGLVAFGVAAASIYIAFIKNPDAKSKFYGFPIARIGVLYGTAQLIVSLIVMVLAQWIPWWIALVVYAIALGAAVIGLVSAETVVEQIHQQDAKLKKDVSLMRGLQSKVSQMAAQSEDAALRALADEFRYSDPVSNEALAELEETLVDQAAKLSVAAKAGQVSEIQLLCSAMEQTLEDRNELCKLTKQK